VLDRLHACLAWLQVLVPTLIERQTLPDLPADCRCASWMLPRSARRGKSQATWRIHLMMDLLTWQLVQVRITDRRTGETLVNFDFCKAEVVLADRGYSHRKGVVHLIEQGAQPIVRFKAKHIPLNSRENGQTLSLAAALKDCAPGEMRTLAAQFSVPEAKTYPVHIHAYRLQGTAAEAAPRRYLRGAKQSERRKWRKYAPSQEALLLAEFVLALTTIEPKHDGG
jgi:hypothetical protein